MVTVNWNIPVGVMSSSLVTNYYENICACHCVRNHNINDFWDAHKDRWKCEDNQRAEADNQSRVQDTSYIFYAELYLIYNYKTK